MTPQEDLFKILFDSSALINIEGTKKMTKIRNNRNRILIPRKVATEIDLPNTALSRFIERFPNVITEFAGGDEEEEYLRIRSQPGIHDAEAAAIAMAVFR
ncbi:MAG TPA: hypothetical protein VF398_09050 [bacterium]|jgi:hypothetical protein